MTLAAGAMTTTVIVDAPATGGQAIRVRPADGTAGPDAFAARHPLNLASVSEVGAFLDALPGGRDRFGLAFKRRLAVRKVELDGGLYFEPFIDETAHVVEILDDGSLLSLEA
jgi:hypothetical protein